MDEWAVNEQPGEDLVRKVNTLLRVVLHIPEPDKLPDDEWAMRFAEVRWAAKEGFLSFEFK